MANESHPNASGAPSLVLFDLDDTLCDHYTSLRLRLRLAIEAAFDPTDAIDVDKLVEKAAATTVGGSGHFAEMLRQHGVIDSDRIDAALEVYLSDRYRGLELFDDALQVVSVVSESSHVGLITNGPSRIQRDKIARLAIGDLFELILVSEEEGIWKPDPLIFRRALDRFGIQPDDAMYVGDSAEHDVVGARAAGITSVWINRRGRDWPGGVRADHEIRSLLELPELLGLRTAGMLTDMT